MLRVDGVHDGRLLQELQGLRLEPLRGQAFDGYLDLGGREGGVLG